jgi:hypothetical protein
VLARLQPTEERRTMAHEPLRYEHVRNNPYRARYSQPNKTAPFMSAALRPVPSAKWQRWAYRELMGKEPMGVLDESDPQFQYNPRTKAGKALLSDLVASHG